MEILEYKGHTIQIDFDDNPEDPREWDHLGNMVCSHGGYRLGDEKLYNHGVSFRDDICKHLGITDTEFMAKYIYLPLYLYDHSGITMNTTGFSCGWDSGQVGYIYVSREEARRELGVKRLNTEKILERLKAEVEEYDHYLTGEVYMWNTGDGWSGGYRSEEDAIAEAKRDIDYQIKHKIKEHTKYIKNCIKNKVNLLYRRPCEL